MPDVLRDARYSPWEATLHMAGSHDQHTPMEGTLMPLPTRSEFLAAQKQHQHPTPTPARESHTTPRPRHNPAGKHASSLGPFANSMDWNDVPLGCEPQIGLGHEGRSPITPEQGRKAAQRVRLTDRDFALFRFLTVYRFATGAQICRHVGVVRIDRRLAQLERAGFIRHQTLTRGQNLWVTTRAGMEAVGLSEYSEQTGSIRMGAVSHTLGLVNLGSDFATGNLSMEWLPSSLHQNPEGETVVHDRDIATNYRQHLALYDGDSRILRNEYLTAWGSEPWTYVLHTTTATHTPDLVLDRGGKGKDIAVELELSPKKHAEYRTILGMYKTSPYAAVVYLTDSRKVATRINHALKEIGGMPNLHVRKYEPVHTNENIFG